MLKLKQATPKAMLKHAIIIFVFHLHPAEAGGKEELAKSELNIY